MNKIALAATFAATLIATGCKSTSSYVDSRDNDIVTMGLSYKDFDNAANKALEEMVQSPLLMHPKAVQGGRYILAVSTIINDTSQRLDTDQLTKKIRIGLLKSGKFLTTTAIGIDGAEDAMTAKVRELKNSPLVDASTVKDNGTVIAPDFSLSGKIIQRTNKINKSSQLVDYYFQLTLTQLETGLAYWEGEYPISKKGSNDSVTW